ncbi:hypothetical protein HYFRA_00002949 [Hymenoscyphus fraxineus]|uniref:Extracellular serine-rich protein n=1 Tax=Hymenoscyphus fraxineus TaxID=746836 RepID=A0A9N9PPK5_9HELO|nr:hypothetical protein HYFRA_00002949 [Hymenoscyphus fraxineus]
MLAMQLRAYLALLFAICLSFVHGCYDHRLNPRRSADEGPINNDQSIVPKHTILAPLVDVDVGPITVSVNTSSAVTASQEVAPPSPFAAASVSSTILVIARDKSSAYSAYSGLNDLGIPYSVLLVPANGASLPKLNDSVTQGNFGLIVVQSEVSYLNTKTGEYTSALTDQQWASIYAYQVSFGVRLVRLDVTPSASTGTVSIGGCCSKGDQQVSFSNDTGFTTAGLKIGAGVTTTGLWHYLANITDSSIATEFAQFSTATADGFKTRSTAGVINRIKGREQMVFFIGFSTDWSVTSNFLQHAWIHWGTRGLYSGYRRAMMTPQVDDMFLETPLFDAPTTNFRLLPEDLDMHVQWMDSVKSTLNSGSDWFIEIGHNGNGNIEDSEKRREAASCRPGPIEYADQVDTPIEFVKPLGSGTDLWPATPTAYPKYSTSCTGNDELLNWFQDSSNLNAFAHVSHTFTHEDLNNATYADTYKEITWNTAWMKDVGISKAKRFSPIGLIPPAITGMHNGDAIKGWVDAGIKNVVGDNTRSILLNQQNEHWPLFSTVATNGYEGVQITPRWASNIYYNCDLPECTTAEWKQYSAGNGTFTDLLALEKSVNVRHLLGLHHDAFMFHQANMRVSDVDDITINGFRSQYSLLMAWVETVVPEFVRLVKWPLVSKKHDDLAASFLSRMNRDACKPNLSWIIDNSRQTITGATVSAGNMSCPEKLPFTFPTAVTDTQGATKEQLGSDPLTLWVVLSGKSITFTFTTPIPIYG